MTRDLFLAILAMDSYARGYKASLKISGSDNIGTRLGDATISAHASDDPANDPYKSDFYAVAYKWNGETIISYRGTDNLVNDAATGYGLGAGSTGGTGVSFLLKQIYKYLFKTDAGFETIFDAAGVGPKSQSDLAIDFFKEVTGKKVIYDGNTAQNVTAVGHSLGGGLAGLISTISGVKGVCVQDKLWAQRRASKRPDWVRHDRRLIPARKNPRAASQ